MRSLLSPVLLCLALSAALAQGASTERRVFAVLVDGKPAGECRLVYTIGDDGSETLSGAAAVRVKRVLGSYHYNYEGTEVWKANRLEKMSCSSDDDGKKCTLQAAAEQSGLRVTVNGKTFLTRASAWPTSYWRLPAPQLLNQALPLLEADTGKVLNGRLDAGGTVTLNAARLAIPCTFYRVTGQAQADLWFDAQGRLVREVTIEDGHRTVIELKELSR